MSKHTKEPWIVSLSDNATPFILNGGTYSDHSPEQFVCAMPSEIVMSFNSYANARRIVACVNALAGVPTDHIERFNQSSIKDFSRDLSVRDELLAELKEALRLLEADAPNHAMDTIYNAIAKAEGV